jgi:hemerythrin-like metal-binding protein
MSQEMATRVQFEVGDSDIDPDHHALALLLEALERVCTDPATSDCRCDQCPGPKAHSCHGLLKEIGSRMQTLLLDHFQREQELMNSLPRNAATKTHCERHRREHVNFSTRYNHAAAKLNDCQPASGAKELEALAFDWIRSHSLEFDAELSALLNRSIDDRHRYA